MTYDETAERAEFLAVMNPTKRDSRRWRRTERRTTAEHESALLTVMQRAASTRPGVVPRSTRTHGRYCTLTLTGAALELELRNVSEPAVTALGDAWLIGAGRYGRSWWVELETRQGRQSVLAADVIRHSL